MDEAAIAADEPQANIAIISLPPDVQVGRVIHGNLVNNDFRYLSGSGMDNSEAFYQSLCAAFNLLMAEGEQHPKLMSIGLHSRISGHPARADALVRFLEYVFSVEWKLLIIGSNILTVRVPEILLSTMKENYLFIRQYGLLDCSREHLLIPRSESSFGTGSKAN